MTRGAYLGATPRDIVFWQNGATQVVRNNTWEPFNLDSRITTIGDWAIDTPGSTTIAAGSNGAILPQATINVVNVAVLKTPASASFPEFAAITIGGKQTIVSYTGVNVGAHQITGCAGGTGTLTTGDTVARGQVQWNPPPGTVANVIAEAAFVANGVGDRGIRFRFHDGLFNFAGGTQTARACVGVHHIQSSEQPAHDQSANGYGKIEVFQDSGAALDAIVASLAAPRLVGIPIGRSPHLA